MQSLVINGTSGRLRSGSRTVTDIQAWRAEAAGDGRLRVTATKHNPDPYWWDHYDPVRLRVDLDFGRNVVRGLATLVSAEPLILEFAQEEEA